MIPQKTLIRFLGTLFLMQLFVLVVIVFWPERAFALSPFVFLGLVGIVALWTEAVEERLIGAPGH